VTGRDDPLLAHLVSHLADAVQVDINAAFVMTRGVALIEEHLRDVLQRGGRLRLLTGDYLGVTEPDALLQILDLRNPSRPDALEARVFESGGVSYHPKAYIVRSADGRGVGFIGSSNLSQSALVEGLEWNYRIVTDRDREGFHELTAAFERLFHHPRTRPLTQEWIDSYRGRRVAPAPSAAGTRAEPAPPPPEPHSIQREALAALEISRSAGNTAGLVVLATGLGKTWLSAFDSNRPEFRRILFVAHRDEILDQALSTFRRIRPTASLGKYKADERFPDADVVFASVQTLARAHHLAQFDRKHFDYVIIDEFHHASAPTYRRLIDYFEPKFLLGLTATPERTDGGDLLELCGENLVYRCDLPEGIRRGLLCPFDYYGVPDDVDYRNIPWRNRHFDETELTAAMATEGRARNALEQLRRYGGTRTLVFCVSQRHADYMAAFLNANGVRAVAVHSGPTSAPRARSIEELKAGTIDVICAVDIFNEGVDLPEVDTILMLRPTESRILWLQQFGRGLRVAPEKRLRVVDYIGNHRAFLLKPRTLLNLGDGDQELSAALQRLEQGTFELPPGCSVTYDLRAVEVMRSLLRLGGAQLLQEYYQDFLEREGVRPRAVEAYNDGYGPRTARTGFGSWLGMVEALGGLSPEERRARSGHRGFLDALETTEMTKSYKMLVLLAMIAEDAVPGALTIDQLAGAVRRIARRYPLLERDLPGEMSDEDLRNLLERNPIEAWVGGRGTGGVSYFNYDGATFATRFSEEGASREPLQDLSREIADWRLAEYLRRLAAGAQIGQIICRVSHANGRPILFLPSRTATPGIPEGWTEVLVEGQRRFANFVQIAVNVVSEQPGGQNLLPEMLREWFGSDAGLPGTRQSVVFEREGNRWVLRPEQTEVQAAGPQLWRTYMREEIPRLYGAQFQSAIWRQGVVPLGDKILFLVTLEKTRMQEAHRYEDKFLSPTEFQWQSQNRTSQASTMGQTLAHHVERGVQIELFVRRTGLVDGRAAPFVYCGPLEFERWEGERPITAWWRLRHALPQRLRRPLGVRA
jgi:superfamily II DNA or RNA helicase/HKD family nuclease